VLHHGQVTLDKPSPKGSTLQRCYDGPCCVGWSVSLADSGRKLEASDRDLKAKDKGNSHFCVLKSPTNYFKSHCLHITIAFICQNNLARIISIYIFANDHFEISFLDICRKIVARYYLPDIIFATYADIIFDERSSASYIIFAIIFCHLPLFANNDLNITVQKHYATIATPS
jgi:hypothetical protein